MAGGCREWVRANDAQRVGNMGNSYFLTTRPIWRPLSNKQTTYRLDNTYLHISFYLPIAAIGVPGLGLSIPNAPSRADAVVADDDDDAEAWSDASS